MSWVSDVLDRLGVTGRDHGTSFPDGAAFRIEIPSVEGPKVLEAVLRAAEAEGITVNRVSQGSGAVLMRAVELRDMAQAGLEAVACANAIEKVHRAAVALEWLERLSPGLVRSKPGAAGLGVPVLP
jgi:hypothetical protein